MINSQTSNDVVSPTVSGHETASVSVAETAPKQGLAAVASADIAAMVKSLGRDGPVRQVATDILDGKTDSRSTVESPRRPCSPRISCEPQSGIYYSRSAASRRLGIVVPGATAMIVFEACSKVQDTDIY